MSVRCSNVTAVSRRRTIFSFSFALVATLLVWLVLGDTTPLQEYFLYHVTIPNLLMAVLVVPYLILTILRPEVYGDAISYALIFLQWLLVGYVIARLVFRRKAG
jgi:hypothetical protein